MSCRRGEAARHSWAQGCAALRSMDSSNHALLETREEFHITVLWHIYIIEQEVEVVPRELVHVECG